MDWFGTNLGNVTRIVITTVGIYAAVIAFTRFNGLRTFSKMSSFDFAITIAVGTTIGSTALNSVPSLLEGTLTIALLFALQHLVSWARVKRDAASLVDNQPVVLMVGETLFEDAMQEARVTKEDIYGKLREANVLDFDEVQAVVLEATGDISVLHGDPSEKRLNPLLLQGVRGQGNIRAD